MSPLSKYYNLHTYCYRVCDKIRARHTDNKFWKGRITNIEISDGRDSVSVTPTLTRTLIPKPYH